MDIIFASTPDFGIPALEKLHQHHNITMVVTQKDSVRGRGKRLHPTPIKARALELGLPVFQPENINHPDSINFLKNVEADVMVVVAYGQILKKPIIELKEECVNIHGSILPKYRGAAPIQRAIIEGEEITGVSIMKIEEGLDSGPVAIEKKTRIGDKSFGELHDELAIMGAYAILEFLEKYQESTVTWRVQDNQLATYAKKINRNEGEIDFNKSHMEINCLIQGFDPLPGAFVKTKEGNLKLFSAEVSNEKMVKNAKAGTIINYDEIGMHIQCGNGVLAIKEIQRPGKKRMLVKDYIKGNPLPIGTMLGGL